MTTVADHHLDRDRLVQIGRRAPDLERAAGALALWYSEHRAGRRPATQLHDALTPTLRRRLAGRLVTASTATRRHRVRQVLVQEPSPAAREATVLLECLAGAAPDAGRVTAVCIRFERDGGTWRVAELTAPEDGEPAVVTESDPYRNLDAFDLVGV